MTSVSAIAMASIFIVTPADAATNGAPEKTDSKFHLTDSKYLDDSTGIQPYSAHGSTAAHGNPGARISLDVKGEGQTVESAIVGLYTGWGGSNMCVDQYEISYRDGFNNPNKQVHNQRTCREPFLATNHKFRVHQLLAKNSKFCGRVKADGQWTPYACVNIIP
ncbi:hypothetical protein [Corynebacterium sp. KPL2838]|uniref:hypothetical protein n=1 Tax=Corynebacterium sp. KPL2838 TaxID=3158316 RepID=UPI0032ED88C0